MKISTLGFPQAEESKLGKILPLAKNHHYALQAFELTQLPDILLLYGQAVDFQAELDGLPAGCPIKIAIVAKQPPEQDIFYHLPFPLVASRVLRVLDNISTATQAVAGQAEDIKTHVEEQGASQLDLSARSISVVVELSDKQAYRQYRVLIVDDSPVMQKALTLELEKLAADVIIDFASSGEEALEQTLAQSYDFIFLDIMMPGIDGFETCSLMRKRMPMKKTPIIMLSAKTSPMDEVKGVISGCTTYLTKPIVHEEFQKVMLRITKWVDNFHVREQDAGV